MVVFSCIARFVTSGGTIFSKQSCACTSQFGIRHLSPRACAATGNCHSTHWPERPYYNHPRNRDSYPTDLNPPYSTNSSYSPSLSCKSFPLLRPALTTTSVSTATSGRTANTTVTCEPLVTNTGVRGRPGDARVPIPSETLHQASREKVIAMSRTDVLLYKARNQFTRKARYATATQTAWAPVGRTMRAVVPDGNGNAVVTEMPIPSPAPDEVLLKVSAVGVNRADVLQIAGKYAPPPNTTPVLGLEASGYLCDGRRVTALLTGGGFAEYVTVPRSTILPLPPRIMDVYSMSQLAAIPEAFIAAYHVLFDVGKLQPGYTVLINAAASGVGVSALQLAAAVPNVTVIACAGSEYKLDACRELGAHHVINYRTQSMAQAVSSITGGEGIHLAIDCVGACQFREIERSLRKDARWVMYGLLSGAKHESIGLAGIVSKHLTLIGTTLRGRSLAQRGRIVRDFAERFGDQFGRDGSLRPVIHAEYEGLHTAPDAFRDLQNNENIGKLVLTI